MPLRGLAADQAAGGSCASACRPAAWDAWVLGAALVVSGVISPYISDRAEGMITFAPGEIALLSPWLLSLEKNTAPAVNATIVGLLTLAVSLRPLPDNAAFGDSLR